MKTTRVHSRGNKNMIEKVCNNFNEPVRALTNTLRMLCYPYNHKYVITKKPIKVYGTGLKPSTSLQGIYSNAVHNFLYNN